MNVIYMYLNSQTISAGVVQVLHRPMLHVVDFIVHFQLNLLYKLFFGMCKHKYVKNWRPIDPTLDVYRWESVAELGSF